MWRRMLKSKAKVESSLCYVDPSVETIGAVITGFDTVNLHCPAYEPAPSSTVVRVTRRRVKRRHPALKHDRAGYAANTTVKTAVQNASPRNPVGAAASVLRAASCETRAGGSKLRFQ